MTRQAIADARSLIRDVAHRNWASDLDGLNQAVTNVVIALDRICDAVESLDRDEGPRLPLDPKVWEVRFTASKGTPPIPEEPGWWLVAVMATPQFEGTFGADTCLDITTRGCAVWARKREGGQP